MPTLCPPPVPWRGGAGRGGRLRAVPPLPRGPAQGPARRRSWYDCWEKVLCDWAARRAVSSSAAPLFRLLFRLAHPPSRQRARRRFSATRQSGAKGSLPLSSPERALDIAPAAFRIAAPLRRLRARPIIIQGGAHLWAGRHIYTPSSGFAPLELGALSKCVLSTCAVALVRFNACIS